MLIYFLILYSFVWWFQFLSTEGFRMKFWFQQAGWLSMLMILNDVHPYLVRQFFSNFEVNPNPLRMTFVVKSKPIYVA